MKWLLGLLLCLTCYGMTPVAPGTTTVTLAWTLSTTQDPAFQTVYLGPSFGVYTNSMLVGTTNTQFTVTNLLYATAYVFAVTVTDVNHLESDYSVPLAYTTPNGPVAPTITGLQILTQ